MYKKDRHFILHRCDDKISCHYGGGGGRQLLFKKMNCGHHKS